jgi:CBS domain-containing protein
LLGTDDIMFCSELMKRNVECCLDTSMIPEAAIAMRDRNVGFLPVCDETRTVLGTLTDRDIVLRVLAEARAPDSTRASDVMTREVVSCRPEDELAFAEDLMIRFQKSRIVCTDEKRRVVGVISLSDIAKIGARGHAGTIAAEIAAREAAPARLGADGRKSACREVMRAEVACCKLTDSITSAALAMRDRNVGFLPVCDHGGALAGTLTDRDLVLRVVAERRSPGSTCAGDVLTGDLVSCSPDDPLKVAEDLMIDFRKSRVVCADGNNRPVGIISLSDVARLEPYARVARVLRGVASRPVAPL